MEIRLPALVLKDAASAAQLLREGRLVAIPTETVYGLGANALDEDAAAAIFTAKGRPTFDPLIIHQSSAERLFAFARRIPEEARRLADAFWPGPLTLVLPKADTISNLVTAGLGTVAMRVPDHPLTLDLLGRLDFPVAAPSANPFGFVSPTTAGHVLDQLGNRIAAVLDGGPCQVGLESTIVGFPGGEPVIYRKGGLTIESIEEVLESTVKVRAHSSSTPEAPGMLSQHYSPGCRIHLTAHDEALRYSRGKKNYKIAVVTIGQEPVYFDDRRRDGVLFYDLSPGGDLAEAAARLYGVLRDLHARNIECAFIQLAPETKLGRAINDRLKRAAATK